MSLSVVAMLLFAAQGVPGAPPGQNAFAERISVTGEGRVAVVPDRVSFSVGVESMGPSLAQVVDENNALVAAVVAALKKAGAADKEVKTSHLSVSPQMDYQQGKRPRIVGYQVSNQVTVTRSDTREVGKFLQAALEAGANQVHGLSLSVADPSRGRDEGLQAAMADARAKAEVLAKAAGRFLGRALSITEGAAQVPPTPILYRTAELAKATGDVPVEQGTEERRFQVSVIFELK